MNVQYFQFGQGMYHSPIAQAEVYFPTVYPVKNTSTFQVDDRFYLCMEDESTFLIDMETGRDYHLEGNCFTYDLKDHCIEDVKSIKIEEDGDHLEMVFTPSLEKESSNALAFLDDTSNDVSVGCFHLYVDKNGGYSYCEYDKYAKMEDFELERDDSEWDKE